MDDDIFETYERKGVTPMKIYEVKLPFWASPALVQARTMKTARELALKEYPTCDCCGSPSRVEWVKIFNGPVPYYRTVVMEITK